MIESILVPLDGSPLAEQALPWAFDLAEKYKARVILLRVGILPDVWSMQDAPIMDTRLDELETQCMKYLMEVETRLKDRNIPVVAEYGVGNATQRIVERSQQPDCSMIVMNSHGRDGLTRWMIGSVAEKVSRHAACPVLLVRKPEAD